MNFAFIELGFWPESCKFLDLLKAKQWVSGLGTNIIYEIWQLEYFEGNQKLDNIPQPLHETEFNSPTLYFLPQYPTSGLEILAVNL